MAKQKLPYRLCKNETTVGSVVECDGYYWERLRSLLILKKNSWMTMHNLFTSVIQASPLFYTICILSFPIFILFHCFKFIQFSIVRALNVQIHI
jgi:hypothetical protein